MAAASLQERDSAPREFHSTHRRPVGVPHMEALYAEHSARHAEPLIRGGPAPIATAVQEWRVAIKPVPWVPSAERAGFLQ
jgi:hypothetical protein